MKTVFRMHLKIIFNSLKNGNPAIKKVGVRIGPLNIKNKENNNRSAKPLVAVFTSNKFIS